METTLYQVLFKDGRSYRVFCRGKNQKKRLQNKLNKLGEQVESTLMVSNGIHTITEFEKL